MSRSLPLLLLGALSLAGCPAPNDTGAKDTSTEETGGTDSDTDTGGVETGDTEEVTSISILAPADGSTITDSTSLAWTVTGFVMDADGVGDTANEESSGHVHIYVDGEYRDLTTEASYEISGLTPGTHTLKVVLAQNNHEETTYTDEVTVTANPTNPLVAITSPASGTALDDSAVLLTYDIYNFTLDDSGGPNEDGVGYYILTVDGLTFDIGVNTAESWVTRLPAGEHVIGIELLNNDGSPLSPVAMDTVTVDVADDARTIDLISPTDGDVINSSAYELITTVDNFTLSQDDIGGMDVDGVGHYHIQLDGEYITASALGDDWLYDLSPGSHLLEVILAGNMHGEFQARDYAVVSSPADRYGVTITSPPEGEIVGSDTYVTASAENFMVDPDMVGMDAEEGHGHYHIYVDGVYYTYSADASTLVSGLSSGDHTLGVHLAGNDHVELSPLVVDEVHVTVP